MLWKTHIRITNEILYNLGMPKSSVEATRLREGAVAPDKWGDYPHHYGKSGTIRKYIMEARRFFLNGDLSNAYFSLGVALHYIQDSYTSLTSRSRHHPQWEQQIEQSYFVDDLEELVAWVFRKRKNERKDYTEIIGFLSEKIEGKKDTIRIATLRGHWRPTYGGAPEVDLNFAFRASLLIVKSVLAPKTCSKLQKELDLALAEHEAMLRKTETVFTDKIVELVEKRDELIRKRNELKKRRRLSGIFPTLKSYFLTFLSKIHNLRAGLRIEEYEQQKHLKKVAKKYQEVTKKISAPHKDWFDITIPRIDITIVEKELLSIQEASRHFGISESIIQDLVKKGKISCYHVKNKELIRKSESGEVLRT